MSVLLLLSGEEFKRGYILEMNVIFSASVITVENLTKSIFQHIIYLKSIVCISSLVLCMIQNVKYDHYPQRD